MKVKYQGREVEATEIEVLTSLERWNEYQLENGKVLMFKEILVTVYLLDNETGPDNSPLYQFQTKKVTRIK